MAYNTTASLVKFTMTTLENAMTDLVDFLDPNGFQLLGRQNESVQEAWLQRLLSGAKH